RRRLSRVGKLAVAVATEASAGADPATLPIVWASRYGDAQRSLDMIGTHANGDPISPTAFTVSVHNGIGAQYSIARGVTQNASSMSAGLSTPAAGMLEAVALLADGHDQALLVHYDAPLPGAYEQFQDSSMAEYAWAVRISGAKRGEPHFTLQIQPDETAIKNGVVSRLPPGLQILWFLLSDTHTLTQRHHQCTWIWSREHA